MDILTRRRPLPDGFRLITYDVKHADELVRMWRASFERAVGVKDPHDFESQIQYLNTTVLPEHRVRLVLDKETRAVVGFLAASEAFVAQLYVHVDYQGRGIGSWLLDLAKVESGGRLRLYTFEVNEGAQRFYGARGFVVIKRGFEKDWQLKDIEYEGVRG